MTVPLASMGMIGVTYFGKGEFVVFIVRMTPLSW